MRVIFIIATFFMLTACNQRESDLANSLVYCTESKPESFNPQISDDVATLDATTHQLYNRLVKLDPISKKLTPDLATHWTKNKEDNSYTFFLRRKVEFHHTDYFSPTRYFSADDVLFSFNRMLSSEHPFHAINSLSDNYLFNHPFTNSIKNIIKVDDYTVKFQLKERDENFLANLTAHYAIILSSQYAKQLLAKGTPQKIDYFPIGTGPFKYKNNTMSTILRYQSNETYWEGKPAIDNLIYSVTPKSIKRYAKLLSGQCDVITYPSPTQIKKIAENKVFTLNVQPTYNIILLALNSKRPALKNKDVRKALSQSINKEQIIKSIYFNTATQTDSLLTKQSWAFNPRLAPLYSPRKFTKQQRQKLDHSFSKPLIILAPKKGAAFNPHFKKTAEIIKYNLSKIGVKSEILSLTKPELKKQLISGNYDIFLTGLNIHSNDPINMFRPLLSCTSNTLEGNSANWCDPDTEKTLNFVSNKTSFKAKIKRYYELQSMLHTQYIYLPIAHILRFEAMQKNISGITVSPLTGISFMNATKVQGR